MSTPLSSSARLLAALGISLVTLAAAAQDRRTVHQPTLPPACKVLHASLRYEHDRLLAPADAPLDSPAIQRAIDSCTSGHAVRLQTAGANNAFLSGPLQLRTGVSLILDRGVHLVASIRPGDFDIHPGSCGVNTDPAGGCRPLLLIDHADHTGILGPGIIEGRGDQVVPSENMTWWQIHNSVKGDVHHHLPWILGTDSSNDLTLYGFTIRNAPNFNVYFKGGSGITVWGITIDAPGDSPNTDGLDPSGVTDMTITHTYIRNGDDNIAIKAPAGQPSTHITISHNHFYEGHGMSIGSGTEGGVSAIRVTDLSIDHQKAGIHIKSNPGRGGLVHDVVYDDVCIRDTATPIHLETTYVDANAPKAKWITEEKFPLYKDITLHSVRTFGGKRVVLRGASPAFKTEVRFDGVEIGDLASLKQIVENAVVTFGPLGSNWVPTGAASGPAPPLVQHLDCAAKFVPFPSQPKEQ